MTSVQGEKLEEEKFRELNQGRENLGEESENIGVEQSRMFLPNL